MSLSLKKPSLTKLVTSVTAEIYDEFVWLAPLPQDNHVCTLRHLEPDELLSANFETTVAARCSECKREFYLANASVREKFGGQFIHFHDQRVFRADRTYEIRLPSIFDEIGNFGDVA